MMTTRQGSRSPKHKPPGHEPRSEASQPQRDHAGSATIRTVGGLGTQRHMHKDVSAARLHLMSVTESLRTLLAVRLSNLTDETTSPERQREVTQGHADQQGWTVVGTAEDLDVSASTVPPFDRPRLGQWLREPKYHQWDALVFWRADRAVRSMADMFALTRWAQEHRKVIVFVSGPFGGDPLTLDLRHDRADPHVNLILAIISFAAEVESQAIKERVNGARAFLLPTDRWGRRCPRLRLPDHRAQGQGENYRVGRVRGRGHPGDRGVVVRRGVGDRDRAPPQRARRADLPRPHACLAGQAHPQP